jgi:hypothetical protein
MAECVTVFAKEPFRPERPLATWEPGDEEPDFGRISYLLKTRFKAPARAKTVVIATAEAAKRLGGHGGRRPRRSEATHDLGLAAVYLHFLATAPRRAANWISEAGLTRRGEGRHSKLADALVTGSNGPGTVIEFGGEYSKAKLAEFHADCEERQRRYELW